MFNPVAVQDSSGNSYRFCFYCSVIEVFTGWANALTLHFRLTYRPVWDVMCSPGEFLMVVDLCLWNMSLGIWMGEMEQGGTVFPRLWRRLPTDETNTQGHKEYRWL